MTKDEALKLALEALEQIALAGMSPAPEMIDAKEAFHARQAWRFIGIAARALEPIKAALAQDEPCKYGQEPKSCTSNPMDCQCAIDAVLAQPEQEPVALVIDGVLVKSALPEKYTGHLYTIPSKREWIGLTDEQWQIFADTLECFITRQQKDIIEDKLKEKNS